MRNKGAVIVLTTIITLLCIYYLSFTLISRGINKSAKNMATDEFGNINHSKKQAYLDSIWREPVFNLFGLEYTYKEIKETELNLGLDLQGGMHVVLEVSSVDIIKALSDNSQNEVFLGALKEALEKQKTSTDKFLNLFYSAYKKKANGQKLSQIFATSSNRSRISYNSSDNEVVKMIEEEIEDAMDRSFNILRTRIDKFGTSQPNIQRLQGTGRIQVEIPGIDNPTRVRKLLQGVAKLEFWEVYDLEDISSSLQSANEMLAKELDAEALIGSDESSLTNTLLTNDSPQDLDDLLGDTEESIDTLTNENIEESNELDQLEAESTGESDTLLESDSLLDQTNDQASPLFALLRSPYNLLYDLKDTATIGKIIRRKDVKALFPKNLKFLWSVKALVSENGEVLELYPIKTGRRGKASLSGEYIANARQDYDERMAPAVSMTMNAQGARIWKKLTGDNINKRIAIVLDDAVYSAPVVQGEIPNGNSSISGRFTIEEAKDLANILEAGSLPAPTRIVEETVIGPTLGKKAQYQGIVSILAGMAIVVLFMVAYYSKGGLIANFALLFNIFFIMGILAQLNASLTLPGIAGIVLTIGMSIDANVLIFERIREELRNGIMLREAIKRGYKKAFSSIVDANVTTFLIGVILYTLGQGPVKGFAITLMIGIACSFFSAVFITRVVVEWMIRKGNANSISFDTPLSKNLLSGLNFDFLSKRKLSYTISAILIVLGVASLIIKGLNLGVDFKGGRSYVVTFNESVSPSDLKNSLFDSFEKTGTEVKTYGANNVMKITTSYLVEDESSEADQQVLNQLISGIQSYGDYQFIENAEEVQKRQFTISSSSKVGATIADDIKAASLKSGLISILAIFLYILIRFRKWHFSLGAVVALVHDTLIVLGVFAFSRFLGISFEVDQVFVAAILTIIGYSINDTVVVFDRIRENLKLKPRDSTLNNFNNALNGTINRTLMTSLTTLIVIVILLLFGGEVLRGFSFALLVGVLVGTYSSVFIATPLVLDMNKNTQKN